MAARRPAAPPPTIRTSYAMVSSSSPSQLVEHDGPLDLLDGLRHLDAAGTGLRAVEGGPAPEHAGALGQDPEPLVGAMVAGVVDEPVSVHDGRRADVLLVAPEDGARRGAGGAQDALGRVVEPVAFL